MRLPLLVGSALMLGAVPALAQDPCVVRGRILGHDGKPLPKAIARPFAPRSRSAHAGRDGRFTLRLPRPGAHVLELAGVFHQTLMLPVVVERSRPFEFEARLKAADYLQRIDSVSVIGEFNAYSTGSAVPMIRRPDGRFAATIDCQAESLRYQLLGVEKGGPTASAQADTFFYRAGRWLSSIPAGRKPVEVVFDPAKLRRSTADPVVRFADRNGDAAMIYPLFEESQRRNRRLAEAYQAHRAAGADPDSFRFDWAADRQALARQVAKARGGVRRQYLLLQYFRIAPGDSDSLLARQALREIPPDSPLWSLEPGGPGGILSRIEHNARAPETVRDYVDRATDAHPDSSVRAGFLLFDLGAAHQRGDHERVGRIYTRLSSDFPGSFETVLARNQYAPNRAIQKGRPVPDAAFAGLEDSTVTYRPADFRGKHVLIDFWAVWCGPCRGEMPYLHQAWEKFRDRGLVLLSVSFDPEREDVARYRGGKWPMPWLHAFAGGFSSAAAHAFEVVGIPKPILVGPDGTIVATEEELRGQKLGETLARALATGEHETKKD